MTRKPVTAAKKKSAPKSKPAKPVKKVAPLAKAVKPTKKPVWTAVPAKTGVIGAAKPAPATVAPQESALLAQQQAFVDAYVQSRNGKQAAIAAGYSPKTAESQASRLLSNAKVRAEVDRRIAKISEKADVTAERVLQEAFGILTADANELIEYRRICCRFCNGDDFNYQRTAKEMEADRAAHDAVQAANNALPANERKPFTMFDEKGGIGYDIRNPINPECPECFGEGIGEAFIKDTRNLSAAAKALYAGVKLTDKGLEVKTHDKVAILEKLMRHFGLYKVDNAQKSDPLAELLALVALRGQKLPIKH